MSNCVAQEIRWLLADEFDRRPSATRRLAKARLVASMAEGLDRARIADLQAGLSHGTRAAFLDAGLSAAERQIVVTALSHDPGERAEISSAAALLDCVGADLIPLPPGLLTQAAATFAAANAAARQDAAAQRTGRRPAALIAGGSLAALALVLAVGSGLLLPSRAPAPSPGPLSSIRPAAQSATRASQGAAAGRAIDRAIALAPETSDRAGPISARGERSTASCDDGAEVAGRSQRTCELGKATDSDAPPSGVAARGASYRAQAPPGDNHSAELQPHFDGPSLRPRSSRRTPALRLGTAVADLAVVPFEVAGRAVLLFGQLGKGLVAPRAVLHHKMYGSRSRGTWGSISRRKSRKSLPRWRANHVAMTAVYEELEFDGPSNRESTSPTYTGRRLS